MFEFHGWINIHCVDDDSEDPWETDIRQTQLCDEIQKEINRISWCFGVFRIFRGMNGQDHLIITGHANHKQQSVIDFVYWLAKLNSDSYGVLNFWDDDDFDKQGNSEFKTICLVKDKVEILVDQVLDPYIKIIDGNIL